MGFWAWEGWGAVGAIAQIVGLATIVAAAIAFFRERREAPDFVIDWSLIGSAEWNGDRYHLVEFRNAGSGIGFLDLLVIVNAHVQLELDYRARRVLSPGESFQLLLSAPEIKKVWVRAATRSASNWGRIVVQWLPLSYETPLGEQRIREFEQWKRRSPLQRLRDARNPRPVEPGGLPAFVVRNGARKDFPAAIWPVTASTIVSSGMGEAGELTDLPYIAPEVQDMAVTDPAE